MHEAPVQVLVQCEIKSYSTFGSECDGLSALTLFFFIASESVRTSLNARTTFYHRASSHKLNARHNNTHDHQQRTASDARLFSTHPCSADSGGFTALSVCFRRASREAWKDGKKRGTW